MKASILQGPRESRLESGASMIFVAASLFVLIGVAALAVDLSGLRLDRAVDQRVADAAATAGAISVFSSNGRDGCEAAFAYVALNAREIPATAFDPIDCSNIPTSCTSATPAATEVKTSGRYTITVVHPVPDAHPLMTSAAIGAPTQSIVSADGDRCSRIGVQVSAVRDSNFGRVLGSDQNTTSVHSVAISYIAGNPDDALNLLLLDRTACHAMRASGGGAVGGGIVVNAVVDGSDLLPGIGASDSDGSECDGSPSDPLDPTSPPLNGVIFKEGNPSVLRADGPPGCDPLNPASGEGCGYLRTFAPADPLACNTSLACQAAGSPFQVPKPIPTQMPGRITRAQIDYRYNCYPNYSSPPGAVSWASDALTAPAQDIPPCPDPTASHIYDLIAAVGEAGLPTGLPTVFDSWTGLGNPCVVTTALPTQVGDFWIDCPVFDVKDSVEIHGNVVFEGDVNITGGDGFLKVFNAPGSPKDGAGFAFFRDGTLTKDGQGRLEFNHTFVYLSKKGPAAPSRRVDLAGGSGSLDWVAPTKGDFEDLALWSDSRLDHKWSGQAALTMEGTFFVPWARVLYEGKAGQNQARAQFVAGTLWASGNGILEITPLVDRSTPLITTVVAELIR